MSWNRSKFLAFYYLLFRWGNLLEAVLLTLLLLLFMSAGFYFVVPFFYLFLTNLFDVLGYFVVLRRFWAIYPLEVQGVKIYINEGDFKDARVLAGYRIVQFMFDYSWFGFIWYICGFKYAVAGWILKMFAVQDLLFYWVVKYPLPSYWTWLTWTPAGFVQKVFFKKEELSNKVVLIQAIIGVLVSIVITIWG